MMIALVDVLRGLRILTIVSWSSFRGTSMVSSHVKRREGTVPMYDGWLRRFCSSVESVLPSVL